MSSRKKNKKETAFIPIGPGGPGGNFPGSPSPFQNNPPPRPNPGFPGPPNQPPFNNNNNNNLNIGNPPNMTPSKNDPEVKALNTNNKNNPKAVSPGSISFCLYKFTYIWEHRGRSYWAYLLAVDRRSISGLRWINRRWVFFGLDLRRIDSFICYRTSDSLTNPSKPFEFRTEYSKKGNRNLYLRTLTSVDIPEIKEDVIYNALDEDFDSTNSYPCKKSRNNTYRIVLQLSYPAEYNKRISEILNGAALAACEEAGKSLCIFRDTNEVYTSLDLFDEATNNIPSAFEVFTKEFNQSVRKSKLSNELLKEVDFSIVKEKIAKDWNVV